MALSEQEQKLLEQLEAALAAEDPKLAKALRGTGTRTLHRKRAALAGIGFVVGIIALVAGMQLSPVVSVLGFVIMLAATIVALTSWRYGNSGDGGDPARPRTPKPRDGDFMNRLEDRWRRRQDEGL